MEKKLRKLTLSRETLRSLDARQVRTAAGGDSGNSDCGASDCVCPTDVCTQYPACNASGVRTCPCSLFANCCSTTMTTE